MKKALLFIILLLFISLSFSSLGIKGHMNLLTVSKETDEGGIADLYLEITKGTGQVFIDTFPLTKTDTQVTLRFAKAYACSYTNTDCSNLDFFYTIRSDASLVGGPSAGAAATVLSIALLDNEKINEKFIMTGTIGSGGSIGPIGGVSAKVKAADSNNFKKVLIPEFSFDLDIINNTDNLSNTNKSNTSLPRVDFQNISNSVNIEIIKIKTIEDALNIFTSKKYKLENKEIEVNEDYKEQMKITANVLCDRTEKLLSEVFNDNLTTNYNKSFQAMEEENYYSAASYCFSSNIIYQNEILKQKDYEFINNGLLNLQIIMTEFESKLNNNIESLSDLQTLIIVKDRIEETKEILKDLNEMNYTNSTEEFVYMSALASERFNSAVAWSSFFNLKDSSKYTINNKELEQTCLFKINEAEDRINYVGSYLPFIELEAREILDSARSYSRNKDYAMCIFEASKAKANSALLESLMGINIEQIPSLVDLKLNIANSQINKMQDKNLFPIMGYSYYEYANSLKDIDDSSSLLFSEYALELSNLDMYFQKESKSLHIINKDLIYAFILGVLFSLICFSLILGYNLKKHKYLDTVRKDQETKAKIEEDKDSEDWIEIK